MPLAHELHAYPVHRAESRRNGDDGDGKKHEQQIECEYLAKVVLKQEKEKLYAALWLRLCAILFGHAVESIKNIHKSIIILPSCHDNNFSKITQDKGGIANLTCHNIE